MALLHNTDPERQTEFKKSKNNNQKIDKTVFDFLDSVLTTYDKNCVKMNNDTPIYFNGDFDTTQATVYMKGVTIGEIKKNYVLPHHQFFMAMGKQFRRKLDLSPDDPRLERYLHGEEIEALGYQRTSTINGRVTFLGDEQAVALSNVFLRFAERVYIEIGSFRAESFDELFEGTRALPWSEFIGRNDAFPVKGHAIKSTLFSVPDCQSIVKKAIVNRLSSKYGISWFNETGSEFKIRFTIIKDNVTVTIDTSGEGLHKRGYRRNSNDAPLKETLGAAMCDLARIFPDTQVYDPVCGRGTLLIESALMATKTVPGLRRFFAAERFASIPKIVWQQERMRAQDLIIKNVDFICSPIACRACPWSEFLLQRKDVLAIDAFVAHLVHDLTDEEDAEAAYLALLG